MNIKVLGTLDSRVLLASENSAVVIDKNYNIVIDAGDARKLLASAEWEASNEEVSDSVIDLAAGALSTLDVRVITASTRGYTIPKGVQAEAQRALDWHKEFHRAGTPVGMNTARTLAKGGQVGLHVVRHIAKYFPRHEVDKKGKGYNPGEPGFPSNGRIAWALWGGDAGWRWAQAIVERENKKAVTADGYVSPQYYQDYNEYSPAASYDSDVDAFKEAYQLGPMAGPVFMARIRLDGSGIDRLYKVDLDGRVFVWDDSSWDDLGHVEGDISIGQTRLYLQVIVIPRCQNIMTRATKRQGHAPQAWLYSYQVVCR
jgi:hypothetical protein